MHIYNIYGFQGEMEVILKAVESQIGVSFNLRESSYLGEYHLYKLDMDTNLMIYENFNEARGLWSQESYSEYPVLMNSNNFNDPNLLSDIVKQYSGVLLKSSSMTDKEFNEGG